MLPFNARLSLHGSAPTRRDWLSISLAALAATRGTTSRSSAAPAKAKRRRAKSVLVVFCGGGQSQLDTWDPKPDAPIEVRGAFGSIATAIPGVRVSEHLPKLAKLADRYTILRSMTHDDTDHGSACYLSLTGQFHPRKSSNPPPRPTDFPSLGAVLHRVRPSDRLPHSSFQVNGPLLVPRDPSPGRSGGFLGRAFDPIDVGDPAAAHAHAASLTLPEDSPRSRIEGRRRLLAQMQSARAAAPESAALQESLNNAYDLLDNPRLRAAFDLDQEPARVRDRYGRYRSGQACLLARRLVEAGVPWVTAFFNHGIRGQDKAPGDTEEYGWDTHNDVFDALKSHLLPRFDLSFSALLTDMHERGLLEDTLVVGMGEFGRAPKVALEASFAGTTPGRKHWAACYSIVLAGAGIRGGSYGSSDRHGGYPQSDPVTPGDLAATLFEALGIDPAEHYQDLEKRPYRVVSGNPVHKLFS